MFVLMELLLLVLLLLYGSTAHIYKGIKMFILSRDFEEVLKS